MICLNKIDFILAVLLSIIVGVFTTLIIKEVEFNKHHHGADIIAAEGKSELSVTWLGGDKRCYTKTFYSFTTFYDVGDGKADYITWDTYDWLPWSWNTQYHTKDPRGKDAK